MGAAGPAGPAGARGPAGPAGPAGSDGASGYQVVQASSVTDTTWIKSATAICPAGKVVMGGGVQGARTDAAQIVKSAPGTGGGTLADGSPRWDRWSATIRDNASDVPWQFTVTAICIDAPTT